MRFGERTSLNLKVITMVLAIAATTPAQAQSFDPECSETLHSWTDETGKKRSLVLEKIIEDVENLYLKICDENNLNCQTQLLESQATMKVRGDDPGFLIKYSPEDGLNYRIPVTASKNWPNDQSYTLAPDQITDPDRKLLKLKTKDTQTGFYDYYYLPKNKTKDQPMKVAVLFRGGESSFRGSSNDKSFIEKPTVEWLRENGYLVLLANYRGRREITSNFRSEGIGRPDRQIADVITALDALSHSHSIDKNDLHLIGHSQGGQFAALLSTRLKEFTSDYTVTKTLLSSPALNSVDGYFGYYEGINLSGTPENIRDDGAYLSLVQRKWTRGALCCRPKGKFTDTQWKVIHDLELKAFQRYYRCVKPKLAKPPCAPQDYFAQSAIHYASNAQGKYFVLVGGARRYEGSSKANEPFRMRDYTSENGETSRYGAYQFQKRLGKERVQVLTHPYGHGFDPDDKFSKSFWIEQLKSFFSENKLSVNGGEPCADCQKTQSDSTTSPLLPHSKEIAGDLDQIGKWFVPEPTLRKDCKDEDWTNR